MCIRDRSNTSQTIINTLIQEVSNKNFEVKTKSVVLEIEKIDNRYLIKSNSEDFIADYVLSLIHI